MSSDEELFMKIGAHVDGELSESERDSIENLVASSPQYRSAAETYQWLDQLAGRGVVPSVSADEWMRVKDGAMRNARETAARGERASVASDQDEAILNAAVSSSRTGEAEATDIVPIATGRRWRPMLSLAAAVLVVASVGLAIFTASGPDSGGGDDRVGPGQANADAIEHLEGARPTIEVDDDGGAPSVYYEDF